MVMLLMTMAYLLFLIMIRMETQISSAANSWRCCCHDFPVFLLVFGPMYLASLNHIFGHIWTSEPPYKKHLPACIMVPCQLQKLWGHHFLGGLNLQAQSPRSITSTKKQRHKVTQNTRTCKNRESRTEHESTRKNVNSFVFQKLHLGRSWGQHVYLNLSEVGQQGFSKTSGTQDHRINRSYAMRSELLWLVFPAFISND